MGITLFQASPFGLSPFANCNFFTRNVSPFHFCLGTHRYLYIFFNTLWKACICCDLSLICPSLLTVIRSRFLHIPENGFFFFCIFIMSESYFVVSLCPISFSSRLQPMILFPFISWSLWMLLQCMFVGWGMWACVFHGLLVSQILWDWNCHMTSSVPFFESKAPWQSCPWMLRSLIYHQWHIRNPLY